MKRYIKSSHADKVIFEDEYFDFVRTSGMGLNDTPWSGLAVLSKGLAEKHVVEVRLNSKGSPSFDGSPAVYKYTDAEVTHGMRSTRDTLDDTREYIAVLEDAIDFAERVNEWLYRNNGGVEASTKTPVRAAHAYADYIANRKEAYRIIDKYNDEQIEYMNKCLDDIDAEVSKMYDENGTDEDVSYNARAIKDDYILGALDEELMTEDEFDELFDALETARMEDAIAFS